MDNEKNQMFKVSTVKKTSEFYDNLVDGKESRGILGFESRFNTKKIIKQESTRKYYQKIIEAHISKDAKVMDFGCGTGSFLVAAAPYCKEIIGLDISKRFVEETQKNIEDFNITNGQAVFSANESIAFGDETFDAVLLVDVIHHLQDIDPIMKEINRVLKPNGKLIVFEPNKLNPLLFIIHALDKNEWGLLKLGTPRIYSKLLRNDYHIEELKFSGLVVGPSSKIFDAITNLLNNRIIYPSLGWLLPKMHIVCTKK